MFWIFLLLVELKNNTCIIFCYKIKFCHFADLTSSWQKKIYLAFQHNGNYIQNSYSHEWYQGTPDLRKISETLTYFSSSYNKFWSDTLLHLRTQYLVTQKSTQLKACWTNEVHGLISVWVNIFYHPSFLFKLIPHQYFFIQTAVS